MKENFERAAAFTLKQEVEPGHEDDGSLHTDPADPGGTTRFGLSQRAYPNLDMTTLTKDVAMQKYHDDYWIPAGCDEVESPLDVVVFDTAFNMGVAVARKLYVTAKTVEDYMWQRTKLYWLLQLKKPRPAFKDWMVRMKNLYKEVNPRWGS